MPAKKVTKAVRPPRPKAPRNLQAAQQHRKQIVNLNNRISALMDELDQVKLQYEALRKTAAAQASELNTFRPSYTVQTEQWFS